MLTLVDGGTLPRLLLDRQLAYLVKIAGRRFGLRLMNVKVEEV